MSAVALWEQEISRQLGWGARRSLQPGHPATPGAPRECSAGDSAVPLRSQHLNAKAALGVTEVYLKDVFICICPLWPQ